MSQPPIEKFLASPFSGVLRFKVGGCEDDGGATEARNELIMNRGCYHNLAVEHGLAGGPTSPAERSEWGITGHLDRAGDLCDLSVRPLPFRVGRDPGLELFLPYATVSYHHAELMISEGKLFVQDLDSTNGTYVNGARVTGTVPVFNGDYLQFADHVFRATQQDTVASCDTACGDMQDEALAVAQIERLISERAITPHYQPIVETDSGRIVGFESLSRSSLFGVTKPHLMFAAASRLNLAAALSRLCRNVALEHASGFDPEKIIFVNTHPSELADLTTFIEPLRAIREGLPERRIVVEIHESAIADSKLVKEIRAIVDDMAMGLAYDDFGVGQARMLELTECPPDYLKFDMSLIRGIDRADGRRRHLLANLVKTVHELGIATLAEGMETPAEAAMCRELGFMYSQGFHYGKPLPANEWACATA